MLKTLYALLFTMFFTITTSAIAAPFDLAQFEALNNNGKPMLVFIYADWCPTCKAQEPIVSELLKKPEFRGVTVLRVDFDKQKDAVKQFKAQYQSTLIAFKGGKEVARSTGDTRKESIATLLNKML